MTEKTHVEKLTEIMDFFRDNKKDLEKMAWSDGQSTEYEFHDITVIDIYKNPVTKVIDFRSLQDSDGELFAVRRKDIESIIENACDDDLERLDAMYESFEENKNELNLKKEKPKKRPSMRR